MWRLRCTGGLRALRRRLRRLPSALVRVRVRVWVRVWVRVRIRVRVRVRVIRVTLTLTLTRLYHVRLLHGFVDVLALQVEVWARSAGTPGGARERSS